MSKLRKYDVIEADEFDLDYGRAFEIKARDTADNYIELLVEDLDYGNVVYSEKLLTISEVLTEADDIACDLWDKYMTNMNGREGIKFNLNFSVGLVESN